MRLSRTINQTSALSSLALDVHATKQRTMHAKSLAGGSLTRKRENGTKRTHTVFFFLLFQISFLSGICVYVILDPERDCCMLIRYSLFDEHGDDLCRHETMNGSNEITCSRTCRRGGSTSTRRRANVRTTIGLVRTRGPKRSRVIKVERSHGAHTNKATPEERSHGAHTNKATPEAK
jgi:hypothetical protein